MPEARCLVFKQKSKDSSFTLKPLLNLSGRRGSNPRPTAWKAVALPTELLPQILPCELANLRIHQWNTTMQRTSYCAPLPISAHLPIPKLMRGQGWIRTTELRRGQIYSLLPLATWLLARHSNFQSQWRDSNPRPADYKSAALANWATLASYDFILINLISSREPQHTANKRTYSQNRQHLFFWEGKGKRIC